MSTDVDQVTSKKIVDFCLYQMKYNVKGIGNECTHFVYAALFEANAEDGVVKTHPTVQQRRSPYVWGRKLELVDVRGGDVAQFQNHEQNIFIYSKEKWYKKQNKRGPLHTGIAYTGLLWGSFEMFESHIHQDGVARMQIRTNEIYYESYGIVVPEEDLQRPSGLIGYLKERSGDVNKLLEDVNWGALRNKYGVDKQTAEAIRRMIESGKTPTHNDKAVAIFFEVKVSGDLRFYRPLVSDRRRMLIGPARTAEKDKLIQAMIRSGRKGHLETGDEYGGDLKTTRVKMHAFEWEYPGK